MTKEDVVQDILDERKMLLETLKNQEEFLLVLDAYKRTLVKSLTGSEISMSLPMKFTADPEIGMKKLGDGVFLLSIGTIGEEGSSPFNVSFRVLRYFKKTRASKKHGEFTWYTTTVLNKHGVRYYVIKDDENNCWKGIDAIARFSQAFECEFPFKNVDEWLGVTAEELRNLVRSTQKYAECIDNRETLERFLN